ncbi:HEAT repeat domain-containing protein, partial [Microbacterium sp. 69-7]|uniref:HEAT repeat domain-containing protein n=1 Tax=Microbacterium sp. 69-7 TaxID=1895784 RepID=UPI0025906ED4
MTHSRSWIGAVPLVFLFIGLARGAEPSEVLDLDPALRDRCLAVLREGLGSSEFWPSMHAAEGLSVAGFGQEARTAIGPKLAVETDAQHRCGLAREIVRSGDLSAVRTLLDELAKPDAYGHAHACESLYKVRQIGDGKLLRTAMETPEPPLRSIMAAAALARCGNPRAFAHIRSAVGRPDETIARTAAWILARVGDATDLPALRAGVGRFQTPLTRAYFEHALAARGDAEGKAALVRNLSNEDPMIRAYAAELAP